MFARITHYKMKAGSVDAAKAQLESMKDQIMALPGIRQFLNTINEDGTGCVISVSESREVSDASQDAVQKLWASFADHLESGPEPHGFDVFVDWRK